MQTRSSQCKPVKHAKHCRPTWWTSAATEDICRGRLPKEVLEHGVEDEVDAVEVSRRSACRASKGFRDQETRFGHRRGEGAMRNDGVAEGE